MIKVGWKKICEDSAPINVCKCACGRWLEILIQESKYTIWMCSTVRSLDLFVLCSVFWMECPVDEDAETIWWSACLAQ